MIILLHEAIALAFICTILLSSSVSTSMLTVAGLLCILALHYKHGGCIITTWEQHYVRLGMVDIAGQLLVPAYDPANRRYVSLACIATALYFALVKLVICCFGLFWVSQR
jgi:hypothetical protein